ncbi:MAG: hypothetical protein ACR2J8_14750 [Thermomicrobiales bacterium]
MLDGVGSEFLWIRLTKPIKSWIVVSLCGDTVSGYRLSAEHLGAMRACDIGLEASELVNLAHRRVWQRRIRDTFVTGWAFRLSRNVRAGTSPPPGNRFLRPV